MSLKEEICDPDLIRLQVNSFTRHAFPICALVHIWLRIDFDMRKFILITPILTLFMWIAIIFDIPVLRQTIVFVYLSFVPGFVLLEILRLRETSVVNTILFSVGLSMAFSMFFGLLVNEIFPMLGISHPLSTIPLASSIGILPLILFFTENRNYLSENFNQTKQTVICPKGLIAKSAILVLPALGIIGSLYGSASVIALMIIAISALYALSVFSNRLISSKSYPLVIFMASIALVMQISLTSKYIIGYDSQLEYYVFKLTSTNGYWHLLNLEVTPVATANFDSMLSITILPTIYSVLMNIGGEAIFKSLYPFIFSLVPVTLYQIYKEQVGKHTSFLSVLFFISGSVVFYGISPLSLNRQIVGEFLLVLSILILLDKKMPIAKRRLLLIVFGSALVVSHYSLMYIYLLFLLSIYVLLKIRGSSNEVLNSGMVLLFFAVAFGWYSFSISPLNSLYEFLNNMFSRFSLDLFQSAARSTTVFGPHPAFGDLTSIAGYVNWAFFVAANFFILIGIIRSLLKSYRTKPDPRFRILTILAAVILFLSFALPNFAPALNFTRFYAITLLFLAPCFVSGGETIVGISYILLRKASSQRISGNNIRRMESLLFCVVLIGYFLSQSGFVNLVTGAIPLSASLDSNRILSSNNQNLKIGFYSVYIPEQDAFGAVWLSNNIRMPVKVYADLISGSGVLVSYGLIPRQQITFITNTTLLSQGGFVYLGQLSIVDGIISTGAGPFNSSRVSPILNENNQIYSNANTEIWCVNSPSYLDNRGESP